MVRSMHDRLERKVDLVIQLLRHIHVEVNKIMADIDDLENAITPLTSTTDSVLALVRELLQRVDAANAGANPRIRAVTDAMRGNIDRLAAAVVANTPGGPLA